MYLEIIIFILIIILVYFSCYQTNIKEGLITSTYSTMNADSTNQNYTTAQNFPNSIVANSNNPSYGNIPSNVQPNSIDPKYTVTSSTNINNTTSTNEPNKTSCDPSTLFTMKNIIRDGNGNIIIRYIDTCGKYYTNEYTQSLNHIQFSNTGPNAVGPNAVGPNAVGTNAVGPNAVGPNAGGSYIGGSYVGGSYVGGLSVAQEAQAQQDRIALQNAHAEQSLQAGYGYSVAPVAQIPPAPPVRYTQSNPLQNISSQDNQTALLYQKIMNSLDNLPKSNTTAPIIVTPAPTAQPNYTNYEETTPPNTNNTTSTNTTPGT